MQSLEHIESVVEPSGRFAVSMAVAGKPASEGPDRAASEGPNRAASEGPDRGSPGVGPPLEPSVSERVAFWNSQFSRCVRCAEKRIRCRELQAGVRANGLAYGATEYVCRTPGCGWSTSFQWDDACEEDYFYETLDYHIGIAEYPWRWVVGWCRARRLPEAVVARAAEQRLTGRHLLHHCRTARHAMTYFRVSAQQAQAVKDIVDDQNPDY